MTHLLHPFSRAHRGGECSSFEGVYNFTPRMAHRGERHSHDHYELYIHLQGGELFSIGSELAPMEPNQLVVIPPYCMHGLIYDEPLTDYERMYLNVTPETLTAAGGGLIDLPGLLEKLKDGKELEKIYQDMDSPQLRDLLYQAGYLGRLIGRTEE